MRKLLFVAVIAASTIVSCKKKYTCRCRVIDKGKVLKTFYAEETGFSTRYKAKKFCEGNESVAIEGSTPTSKTACELQ